VNILWRYFIEKAGKQLILSGEIPKMDFIKKGLDV